MAYSACNAFSQDGQYFAHCGIDGKLKIWETATNRLKQEYIPNLHLNSPCSVLCWISVNIQATNAASLPWKKRKRKGIVEEVEQKAIIVMGSANGMITLYDVAAAAVCGQLENGHSSCVTALTWSVNNGLFTVADDHYIIEWNMKESGIKSKWKSGKAKVTALEVTQDGKFIISAERIIKWWNLSTKQVIRTFTGHAGQVTSLNAITVNQDTSYLISGASDDRYLSIWALDETKNDKCSAASLTMQDEAMSVSVHVNEEDSQMVVLAVTRSGQAHIFKYQPNGRSKPLKPTLTIAVASDGNQKDTVQQIPIFMAKLVENEKLLLAYGSYINLTFEKITPDYSDKIQYLIRSEIKKTKERKEESITKVKAVITENDVAYLAPGAGNTTTKRNRTSSAGSQLPLRDRLENLSFNVETNSTGKTPLKGANMIQLLMQGLNSKDRTILNSVLYTKNESTIRNTIARLPVQAITPLLKELCSMLHGKTYPSKIATMWLHILVTTHAAHLLSHPDIGESLSPILSLIDAKLMLLTEISKLRGRVSLVTGQISGSKEEQDSMMDDTLLFYQDADSSDEGPAIEDADLESESDENWEENSDQEEQNENDSKSIIFKEEDDMSS
ncbi:WD repeat-containing protein 43-like [Polistes fuscatus]|uniref:WD repeat-containing protein 43-like n=1 Tax=Polistes fuscatus TaxID=30207 RepID=UPI001CA913CB|nr:WD repeat-containing protein 43-like [Polistes fuscatus]XP_043502431.1 WD repeat-containing protein 43-like [Polistes fuscatus]